MAKRYTVYIPIVGQITCTVEAESEEEAVANAWQFYNMSDPNEFDVEWEADIHIREERVAYAEEQ